MAIPTEAEFQEAIRAFSAPLPDKLLGRFTWDYWSHDLGEEIAKSLIADTLDHHMTAYCKAGELPATKWLFGDRLVGLAYEAAHKKAKSEKNAIEANRSDWIEYIYRALNEAKDSREEKDLIEINDAGIVLQEFFDANFHPIGTRWSLALLPAFCEYFYRPNTVSLMLEQRKQIAKLEKEATSGADALRTLAAMIKGAGGRINTAVDRPINAMALASRRLALEAADTLAIPIARNDKTARERLLLWRIWLGMQCARIKDSPTAIKRLLLVEGVENQIDDRATDSMLRGFRQGSIPRNRRHPRYLIESARGYNYREVKMEEILAKQLELDHRKIDTQDT